MPPRGLKPQASSSPPYSTSRPPPQQPKPSLPTTPKTALTGSVLIAMVVRELLRAESERRKAADANRRLESTTESLMEALEDATAATQAKSQFLATMSHELRTPLNAVIGFAEALEAGLAGPLEGRPREYIGYIRDSGSHLLGMINEILDLSKLDARRVELRDDVIDPGEGLATALRIIRDRKSTRLNSSH